MQARKGGLRAAFFLSAGVAVLTDAPAAGPGTLVVRCPGPPVLYTSSLSEAEAQARGCERLHSAPVAIGGRTAPAAAAEAPAAPTPRVSAEVQRQRDQDARTLLQAELAREIERREGMRRTAAAMSPQANEVARRSQTEALQRVEADIEAIRRELQRLR